MAAHIFFACWLNYKQEIIGETVCLPQQTHRSTTIYSCKDKHRRLWRPAVATQPTIAGYQSAPCPEGTRIHQKPTASSEGAQLWDKLFLSISWFREAGPTVILNTIREALVPLRVGCSKSALFSARFLTQ